MMPAGSAHKSDAPAVLTRWAPFRSRRRLLVLVTGLAAVVATAGIARIPFYTRGEPREALVVREMVAGNGWVLPLRDGTEIPRKPPLFHWAGAAASLLLGRTDEVTVRLPSAASSIAAVLLIFVWASSSGGPLRGGLAALVTTTSVEWMRAATVARVDMLYSALLTVTLVSLDRQLRAVRRRGWWCAAFYASMAAATLTKGPIAIVIPALTATIIAWTRPEEHLWRRMRPVLGFGAVAAVTGGWLLLALQEHGRAYWAITVTENLRHLFATGTGGTGHAHGIAYLLGVAALGLLPWTVLVPVAISALRDRRDDPAVIVSATWTAVVLAIHLLASAKRSVYLLPAYPAIALLIATGAERISTRAMQGSITRWVPWLGRAYALIALVLGAAVLFVASTGRIPEGILGLMSARDRLGSVAAAEAIAGDAALLITVAVAMVVAVPILLSVTRQHRLADLIVTFAAITAAAAVAFNTSVHPVLARAQSVRNFMSEVTMIVGDDEPLYFVGSADPAAVFYAGRRVPSVPRRAAVFPPSHLLVWERDWRLLARDGRVSEPIKVSGVTVPHRGHLLLVTPRIFTHPAAQPRRHRGHHSVPSVTPGRSPVLSAAPGHS